MWNYMCIRWLINWSDLTSGLQNVTHNDGMNQYTFPYKKKNSPDLTPVDCSMKEIARSRNERGGRGEFPNTTLCMWADWQWGKETYCTTRSDWAHSLALSVSLLLPSSWLPSLALSSLLRPNKSSFPLGGSPPAAHHTTSLPSYEGSIHMER